MKAMKLLTAFACCASLAPGCTKDEAITPEPTGGSGAGSTAGSGGQGGAAPKDACPGGLPGPALVRLPATDGSYYCMDQREVTFGEYKAFLDAKKGDTTGQPAECSWNASFTPKIRGPLDDGPPEPGECSSVTWGLLDTRPDFAARCVDFCDAFAYCQWAGKRLCGPSGHDGSKVYNANDIDAGLAAASKSEWSLACTQGGKTTFPYGDAAEPGKCIDGTWIASKGEDAQSVTNLASSQCHGTTPPYDEIFDLGGSVVEWGNVCWTNGCAVFGRSYANEASEMLCAKSFGFATPIYTFSDVGFRCCADAVAKP